jgi:hypothetical protein
LEFFRVDSQAHKFQVQAWILIRALELEKNSFHIRVKKIIFHNFEQKNYLPIERTRMNGKTSVLFTTQF